MVQLVNALANIKNNVTMLLLYLLILPDLLINAYRLLLPRVQRQGLS